MALTDLTRISTSGIATGTSLSGAILHGDAHFRGTQVGVNSAIFDSSDDALEFNDNVKLTFGNGGDLKLYHTGSHSYIQDSGDGDLVLLSNQVAIRNAAENEDLARFIENTGVQLYDGANTVRLATNDNGVVVTGILTATGFSGPLSNTSGISTFYDLRVSNNLTVEGTTTTLDTNLIGVDRVEVGANSNTVTGIAVTQTGSADILNLFNANGEQVTVLSSGNVGIGSAIPELDLDVTRVASGDNVVKFENRASALSLIKYPNVNNSDVRAGSDYGNFAVYTGGDSGSRKLKVEHGGDVKVENGFFAVTDPSEKIGIGLASPTKPLHIYTAGVDSEIRLQTNSGTEQNSYISLRHATGHLDFYTVQSGTNMKFHIANNERLKLEDSGLTVTGVVTVNSTANQPLVLNNINANGQSSISFQSAGSTKYNLGSNKDADGNIDFFIFDQVNGKHRFNINASGSVGIGTDIPSALLHLHKTSGTALVKLENTNGTSQLDIRHTNGYGAVHYIHQGTEKWRVGQTAQSDHFSIYQSTGAGGLPYRLFIQNNGEVGINTSDPTNTLHLLRNNANHGITLQRAGTNPGSALIQVSSFGALKLEAANNLVITSGGSQQIFFNRGATEVARFDTSGRLGIGTGSPSAKTHIYDSTNTSTATEQFRISGGNRSADTFETGFRFFTQSPSANGNRHVRFTSNGNIGLEIQPIETSSGNAAVDKNILLCPDGGKVGISTNAPSAALLDIATASGSNDHLRLRRLSSDSNVATNWSLKPYAGNLYFRSGGSSDKIYFDDSGDINIMDGDLILANGHGIDFSATANSVESGSTMSSELLDDYEEGTATFKLHIAGGEASGVSYSYNTAPYVKVGRIVYCAISMFATSVPADTGAIDIAGLPFQDGGGGGYREPAFLAANHGGVSPNGTVITGAMHGSGTKIRIRKNGNQDLDGGDIGGTFWMHGHITYMST